MDRDPDSDMDRDPESGIRLREDVEEVQKGGASAILVGESLMRDTSAIESKVAELLG